ncbi:MAG: PAS domain S-box protein, partial [Bacteriovoracaceae bacterium]|nr:PAS domain S-box protein [Bacteriovoracaceae bacterium]
HYEEIFNASHDAIFIQHATTGKIIDVNDRMLEMYGYLKNEVINFDVDLFSSDDPRFSHKVAKEKFLAAVNVGPQSFEWQAKRKNGELFPVEVHLSHSQIGNYPRLLAIVRDITERKKTTAD